MFHAPNVLRVRKRLRPAEAGVPRREGVKFEDVRLYLVEKKMGRSRRSFLTQLARSKGFIVEDVLSDEVTHVVSEESQASSLWKWLKECALKNLPSVHVLDISWFTDSMREGRPVAVETRHLVQDTLPTSPEGSTPTPVATVSQYACQRRTTTENNNKIFTEIESNGRQDCMEKMRLIDPLRDDFIGWRQNTAHHHGAVGYDAFEVLAENYEFNEIEGPCLAFRRAASVLKSLPWAVQCLGATQDLPCLGEHTKAVMEEILQHGHSFEVERILSDERYQILKLFTSVFGVGPKTAEKWYRRGLRSFSDILADRSIRLNRMQQSGFLHYEDISRAVSKAEARSLRNIIDEAVHAITPAAILALTGGFRRGKEFGHDVDFIVTTPELGREETLLPNIIDELKKQGILLYCDYQASTFDIAKLPSCRFEAMDHFAKCFLILRLEGSQVEGGLHTAEGDNRGWRAVRVDLVSPPVDRYAFALLGWTGSRVQYEGLYRHGSEKWLQQFERDLRRFAQVKRRMLLDNHALFDKTKKEFLAATTEKDIFAHLGLEYIEPWQRNA